MVTILSSTMVILIPRNYFCNFFFNLFTFNLKIEQIKGIPVINKNLKVYFFYYFQSWLCLFVTLWKQKTISALLLLQRNANIIIYNKSWYINTKKKSFSVGNKGTLYSSISVYTVFCCTFSLM